MKLMTFGQIILWTQACLSIVSKAQEFASPLAAYRNSSQVTISLNGSTIYDNQANITTNISTILDLYNITLTNSSSKNVSIAGFNRTSISRTVSLTGFLKSCISACTSSKSGSDCEKQCEDQMNNSKAADDLLTERCLKGNGFTSIHDAFPYDPEIPVGLPEPIPYTPWKMTRAIRALTPTLINGVCQQKIEILDATYDWAPVQGSFTRSCSGLKATVPSSINYLQCIYSYGPLKFWYDGPSIPDTIDELNVYAKSTKLKIVEAVLGLLTGGLVNLFIGTIADSTIADLASILHQFRTLFFVAGINHDICYHNGLASLGQDRHACNLKFREDMDAICRITKNPGNAFTFQTTGIKPLLFTFTASCYGWADLFYSFVEPWRVGVKIDGLPINFNIDFAADAYKWSDVKANYHSVDTLQYHLDADPRVLPVPAQGVKLNKITANFYIRGDDKDPDTTGSLRLTLNGGPQVLQELVLPKGEWKDQTTHELSHDALNLAFSPAQFEIMTVTPTMTYVTQGHDLMKFNLILRLEFSDRTTELCYDQETVGNCGGICVLGVCPTNRCSWIGPTYHINGSDLTQCNY